MILQSIFALFINELEDFGGRRGLDKKLEGRGWRIERREKQATAKALTQSSQRERSFAEENRQRQKQQL
jgi:hypothetical protein